MILSELKINKICLYVFTFPASFCFTDVTVSDFGYLDSNCSLSVQMEIMQIPRRFICIVQQNVRNTDVFNKTLITLIRSVWRTGSAASS